MTMITRKIDLPNNTRSRASINLEQSEMVMQLNIVYSICKIFWLYNYAKCNTIPSARWIAETNSSISVKTSFFLVTLQFQGSDHLQFDCTKWRWQGEQLL
uniref:Uncharacterized protein n=1 Tax=Populus trichocarpa TaxID=3694 RepID=U5GJD3_POPTR